MGNYIIKLADYYLEWSTITDAPTTYGMTLEEFKRFYLEEYGRDDFTLFKFYQRLERVERAGTSCMDGRTVDKLISYNRAGVYEGRLSKRQIIHKYIKNRPGRWNCLEEDNQ